MSGKTSAPVCTYDFRISKEGITHQKIIEVLKEFCKKWVFQEEKGEKTGYVHYQGRFSLKMKNHKHLILNKFKLKEFVPNYLEKTSKENQTNTFYVTKEDTKIAGPWKDTDVIKYIPDQYITTYDKLYPFQKAIVDSSYIIDTRTINIVYCSSGNTGKTFAGAYCKYYMNGRYLAPLNDAKELVQMLCDSCMDNKDHSPNPIIVDLPRSMNKKDMNGIWNAVEQIKNGMLYDTRYHFKYWDIKSPAVWVFTNQIPDLNSLSMDRWKIWTINEKKEFIPFVIEPKINKNDDPTYYFDEFEVIPKHLIDKKRVKVIKKKIIK